MAKKKVSKALSATQKKISEICDKAIEQISSKVLMHYKKHPDAAWTGHNLVDLEKTIKAVYKDMGMSIGKSFKSGLSTSMQDAYDKAVEDLKTNGKRNAILGKPNTGLVKQYMESTFEQVAMRTTKMSHDHIQKLRNLSADVLRTASLTGASRAEVTKQMLARASEIPGFKFVGNNGVEWKDKTYFSMLARTELMNASRAAYDDKCAAEGCDVVELDIGGNCCDACAKWEGKQFSLTGATKGLPTKQDLIDDGVFHPNCTHSYTAVPDWELPAPEPEPEPEHKEEPQPEPQPESAQAQEQKPEPKPSPQEQAEIKRRERYHRENMKAVDDEMNSDHMRAETEEAGRKAAEEADRQGLTGDERDDFIETSKDGYIRRRRKNLERVAQEVDRELERSGDRMTDPPRLVFDPKTSSSHYDPSDNSVHIKSADRDGNIEAVKWNQTAGQTRHEVGHSLHIPRVDRSVALVRRVRDAAEKDWRNVREYFGGSLEALRGDYVRDTVARLVYGDDFANLPLDRRHNVVLISDTIGSISDREGFGFGHDDLEYRKQNITLEAHAEAVANVHALKNSDERAILFLKELFPNLAEMTTELDGIEP